MTVRYHIHKIKLTPEYLCRRQGAYHYHIVVVCQRVLGEYVDQAIGQLLMDTVTSLASEITLKVREELQTRLDEVDHLPKEQVELGRFEADLAQRRC